VTVNRDKSPVFLEAQCDVGIKHSVKNQLGLQPEVLHDTYFGIPTEVGSAPTTTFNFVHDKVWKRLCGCSDRPLSRMGKEVFIKAIMQAIPPFVMSYFQVSVSYDRVSLP
jgi:hypothetical protein